MQISRPNILKRVFNAVVPQCFYVPSFKVGDFIVTKNGLTNRHFDLPRFEADTLYSVGPDSQFKIEAINRGYYRRDNGNADSAVFIHDKLTGIPHYELSDMNEFQFYDNYKGKYTLPGSRIHVPVDIVEQNFKN